ECSAAELTGRERRYQRLLVHDAAAGHVQEPRAGLHARELASTDDAAGLARAGEGHDQEVDLGKAASPLPGVRDTGFGGDHTSAPRGEDGHPETAEAGGD